MVLSNTVDKMLSEDYKERFIAEYQQLSIRHDGLKKMLDNWDKENLNFIPTCPRSTYDLQIKAISTTLHDGMYYECTYNGDKNEMYLDAYKKFENKKIICESEE